MFLTWLRARLYESPTVPWTNSLISYIRYLIRGRSHVLYEIHGAVIVIFFGSGELGSQVSLAIVLQVCNRVFGRIEIRAAHSVIMWCVRIIRRWRDP